MAGGRAEAGRRCHALVNHGEAEDAELAMEVLSDGSMRAAAAAASVGFE
jgi:hypothetical protein